NGSPDTIEAFNALPVKVVAGAMVYLGDVAHVHDGAMKQTNVSRIDGQRTTYMQILKKDGASTLTVVESARALIPQIEAAAHATGLETLTARLEFDQSVFVRGALNAVLREALAAGALVSFMTLFFLGSWRS